VAQFITYIGHDGQASLIPAEQFDAMMGAAPEPQTRGTATAGDRGAATAGVGGTSWERAAALMDTPINPVHRPAFRLAQAVMEGHLAAPIAAYEAYRDPSLANVTNAVVQAGLAMTPFKPAAGMATAGVAGVAGLGEAARRQYMAPLVPSAQAQSPSGTYGDPVLDAMEARARGLEQQGQATIEGRSKAESAIIRETFRRQAAEIRQQIMNLQSEKVRSQEAQQKTDYNAAVERADRVLQEELSRNRRFADTEVGKVWNKMGAATPAVLAMGAGGLSRLATGGGNALYNYGLPLMAGLSVSIPASNYPLASDAYLDTPVDNPVRTAYSRYAYELPDGHPNKAKAEQFALSQPHQNPVRMNAQTEFTDTGNFIKRNLLGAVEGMAGMIGADIVRAPGRVLEGIAATPARMRNARAQAATGGAQGGPAGGPGANGLGRGIVHQQPPPQPVQGGAAQTGAAYDPAVHGPISRAYLNELLTHGSPTRAALTGLGSVDDQATQAALALQSRYHAANVPLVNQDEMVARASKSLGEYNLLNAALSAQTGANRQITNPSVRKAMLNMLQGRPGYLSVPPIVAYGMMQGQPDEPMY